MVGQTSEDEFFMAALIEAIAIKRKMYFEFEGAPYHCLDVDQAVNAPAWTSTTGLDFACGPFEQPASRQTTPTAMANKCRATRSTM